MKPPKMERSWLRPCSLATCCKRTNSIVCPSGSTAITISAFSCLFSKMKTSESMVRASAISAESADRMAAL